MTSHQLYGTRTVQCVPLSRQCSDRRFWLHCERKRVNTVLICSDIAPGKAHTAIEELFFVRPLLLTVAANEAGWPRVGRWRRENGQGTLCVRPPARKAKEKIRGNETVFTERGSDRKEEQREKARAGIVCNDITHDEGVGRTAHRRNRGVVFRRLSANRGGRGCPGGGHCVRPREGGGGDERERKGGEPCSHAARGD